MTDEEKKALLDSLCDGLVSLVSSNFNLGTFVCPECGCKVLVEKNSIPFCLKCFKLMVKNG